MARTALGLNADTVAQQAGVGINTVTRFERGEDVRVSTIQKIQTALEAAGAIFLDETNTEGPGVRLRKLRVGDKVALRHGTVLWGQHQALRGKIGHVSAVVDDGTSTHRVTVEFDGEEPLRGINAGQFELG